MASARHVNSIASHTGRARLIVNLDALAANYQRISAKAREYGARECAAVVKANAYGLGAAPIAKRLVLEGCNRFFVATASEARELREAVGLSVAIYVLNGATPDDERELLSADARPILNSPHQAENWARMARANYRRLRAGVQIDTGMNRLGMTFEEARTLASSAPWSQDVNVDLVMSHFACSDEAGHPMNARQADGLRQARGLWPDARMSLADSCGVFLGQSAVFQIVRPGIALYGGSSPHDGAPMQTVVTFDAPVLQVRTIKPGESVGYGASYVAETERRIAIVGAGYADGVLRAEGRPRYGWVGGARAPFAGRVSMDLTALDVTDSPREVHEGDRAELIGPHCPLEDAARAAGTISYELLTRLGERVERHYVGGGARA